MKRNSSLFQQYISYVLLTSLFLQSCGGFNNPIIPIEGNKTGPIQTHTQQSIIPQANIEHLVGQVLTAQGGHTVAFHEVAGKLKADVAMNAPEGFNKIYDGLDVYVEQGIELASLPQLSREVQQRRIHFQPAQGENLAKVILYKGSGLMGGGEDEKDNKSKKEAEGEEEEEETESANNGSPYEIVVFCGNPGVGKSSLCNSIFQKPVFKSGASVGKGMTTHKQEFRYNERLYIDTPGLDDIELRKQAAEEIEKALKHNDNYKVVFVATLEGGRIRPADLVTINTVCNAIKTDFEYGLIFNKVTNPIERQIKQEGLEQYLTTLHKKPWTTLILKKDSDMEDEENVYFPMDSVNRERLVRFIYALKANKILDRDVNKIDVREFQEKINEIEQRYKKEIAELSKRNEEQAAKINTIDTQLKQSSEELEKQKQETKKIKQQQQQYKEEMEKQMQEIERIKQQQHREEIKRKKQEEESIREQQYREEIEKQKQEIERIKQQQHREEIGKKKVELFNQEFTKSLVKKLHAQQEKFITFILQGNLEKVRELYNEGALLTLASETTGLYPLVAAAYSANPELLYFIERELKEEVSKYWDLIDMAKVNAEIQRVCPTELKGLDYKARQQWQNENIYKWWYQEFQNIPCSNLGEIELIKSNIEKQKKRCEYRDGLGLHNYYDSSNLGGSDMIAIQKSARKNVAGLQQEIYELEKEEEALKSNINQKLNLLCIQLKKFEEYITVRRHMA